MKRAALALAAVLAAASPFQREQDDVRTGNERLAAGDPAGARARYDAAEAAVGPRPEIDFDRGDALLAEGRAADAAAAFRRAAGGARPALASRALQNLASALLASGDRDGALRALEGALLADPANDDARWNLEVLLRGRSASKERSPGPADASRGERRSPQDGKAGPPPRDRPDPGPGSPAPREATEGAGRPRDLRDAPDGADRTGDPREGAGAAQRPPLSRQESERLLDALRARERRAPLFGRERPRDAGRADAAKEW